MPKALKTLAVILAMQAAGLSQTPVAREKLRLTVSVAASLRNAIEEIQALYARERPDVSLVFNFGASGALQQQIEQGAPVDIFLPASPKQMDTIQKKGLVLAGTRKDLLVNQVVLIAPPGSQSPRDFAGLAGTDVKLIALGDPSSVPAGDYGRQVLRSMGIWANAEPKLILAKDVRQVLTYIESGNADAGIVYASDAQASGKVRVVAMAPEASHDPVVYPVAVMHDAKEPALAKGFLDFLSGQRSEGIFRKYGFLPGVPSSNGKAKDASAPLDLSPLWISLKTSAVATVFTFILGLLVAQTMSRYRGKGKEIIDGVLTLPLVLPPTVIGFFLLLLFGRNSGLGHLLQKIGLTIAFSWSATVIAATVVAFPLMYRTSLGALEQVTPTLLQAARTLGASEWRVFRRITLPLALPGIMAGTVLAFARALGEFGATLMLAGNIPGRTQTMPVAIFFAAEGGEMNRAMGWVILIVAVSLAVIAALNYWSRYQRASERPGDVLEGFPSDRGLTLSRYRVLRQSASQEQPELIFDARRRIDKFALAAAFRNSGGALGLLGASGSGKSMTLRCIAGLDTPDNGRIVLNGRVLFDADANINLPPSARRIGVLFQDYALFPHLTVRENIAFGLEHLSRPEQKDRTANVVELVRLEGLLDRYPAEISGGQKQRVALARALAIQPDALLLDEPFSALDPHLRRQLEEQLREALTHYEGVVLFVTHDLEEAFRFCKDLLVLDAGEVIASGPKHQLFEQPRTIRTARLTGCKNIARAQRGDRTTVQVPEWKVNLSVADGGFDQLTHVGIRAHHLKLTERTSEAENVFPCWLMESSESPHEMTLYLHLQRPPEDGDVAHLQMEITKDQWSELRAKPQPWNVCLASDRLLLLTH